MIVPAKDVPVMVNGQATAPASANCLPTAPEPDQACGPAKDVLEKVCVLEQGTVLASASCPQEVVKI